MAREKISAVKRDTIKRKTNQLRRAGFIPAIVYGPGVDSLSIQVSEGEFLALLRQGLEVELIELMIEGEQEPRVVLMQDIQTEPVHNRPVHVDFFEVDLTEPVEVDVPIELIGEVLAVEEKRGMLLHNLQELPIKVLPDQIPPHIEVDVSVMREVGDHITVGDLALGEEVEILVDNPEELIVKVDPVRQPEVIEEEEMAEAEGEESIEEDAETSTEASESEGTEE